MPNATAITGSGVHAPEDVVTNEELCACFNTWVRRENDRNASEIAAGRKQPFAESDPAFVEKVSGIRRRHYQDRHGVLDPDRMCPSIPDRADDELSVQAELACGAAKKALAEAGRRGEDVDLVIVAASSLQRPYPAIAIEVQAALGARGAGFDLSVGCASACFGIQIASEAVRAGSAQCALVCVPEVPSAYSNFRDRDSHFILGDAGAAVVLEPLSRARAGAFEIVSSAGSSHYSTNVRNNGGFLNRCDPAHRFDDDKLFYQNGRKVFRDIVQLVPRLVIAHLDRHELAPADVARFWLHQANGPMNTSIARRLLGRDADEAEAPTVLDEYGNTAAAGALIAFHQHRADLAPGALGVLCAFGAGYTVGSQLLRRV